MRHLKVRRLISVMAASAVVMLTPSPTRAYAEQTEVEDPVGPLNPNPPNGLKLYEWNPLTNTGKCFNVGCFYGWCCWVY